MLAAIFPNTEGGAVEEKHYTKQSIHFAYRDLRNARKRLQNENSIPRGAPFPDNSRDARYLHRSVLMQHARNFRTCSSSRADVCTYLRMLIAAYYLARRPFSLSPRRLCLFSRAFSRGLSVVRSGIPSLNRIPRSGRAENFIKARSAIEISDSLKRKKDGERIRAAANTHGDVTRIIPLY